MTDRVLSVRQLNRTTLSRQLLLSRSPISVSETLERLVGLQAQQAQPPFVGLWTRLQNFQPEMLARPIKDREIVKVTAMRGTLHLLTTDDFVRFRTTLQPMLTQAWTGIAKQRGGDFSLETLLARATEFIGEKPRTFAEISGVVAELMPDQDVGALRYAVRTHLPLVQVPTDSPWSYPGRPSFALAESWIGRPIDSSDSPRELLRRYLRAFGPASVTDMQTWSGFSGLKPLFDQLRTELAVYRDEQGRELFDLPDLPLSEADLPAPVRFLPEFDNILLAHSKRTRIIEEQYRSRVYLPGLRVAATFLIDGFVKGTWKVEKKKRSAILRIEPFDRQAEKAHAELEEEGERLLQFLAPDADSRQILPADSSAKD